MTASTVTTMRPPPSTKTTVRIPQRHGRGPGVSVTGHHDRRPDRVPVTIGLAAAGTAAPLVSLDIVRRTTGTGRRPLAVGGAIGVRLAPTAGVARWAEKAGCGRVGWVHRLTVEGLLLSVPAASGRPVSALGVGS